MTHAHVQERTVDRERTAAAIARNQALAAERAIDDPAKLARAARIVRTALARHRLTIEELTAGGA